MRTSFKNSRAKMICIARHLFICFCIARDLFTCFCIARHLFTCVCIARHLFPRFCMQVPCSHASACCVHKRKLGSCKTRFSAVIPGGTLLLSSQPVAMAAILHARQSLLQPCTALRSARLLLNCNNLNLCHISRVPLYYPYCYCRWMAVTK